MSSPPPTTRASASVAVVALGSNLAHDGASPEQVVRAAAQRLGGLSDSGVTLSSLHRTPASGLPTGSPDFCNAVALIQPPAALSAEALLRALLQLEAEFGRERPAASQGAPYASRTLDLDLIYCRGETCHTATLTLPHPLATRRDFVMLPLAEVWPALVLPGQSASASELASELSRAASLALE